MPAETRTAFGAARGHLGCDEHGGRRGAAPSGWNDRARAPAFVARPALRILVAEDNELNTALLQELLIQSGHRVQFANNGRDALALATAGSFELLLLDLHMPEMDGFEVVQAIRASESSTGKHLPIVALTARSSSRDRDRCLAAGMDDFLSKPIEADALSIAIDRMVAAFPPARVRDWRLLDASAILRACGGRPAILERIVRCFSKACPVNWRGSGRRSAIVIFRA